MQTEMLLLKKPHCHGMEELPSADIERARVQDMLQRHNDRDAGTILGASHTTDPLFIHLSHGLAYTTGSALGSIPPSTAACLAAFSIPNVAGLSAGARAWSKHFHRSIPTIPTTTPASTEEDSCTSSTVTEVANDGNSKGRRKPKKQPPPPTGWWGSPSGPVSTINEKALALFSKIMDNATWRNLHWLPHQVLVYEVRVTEGYGMRWSQDRSKVEAGVLEEPAEEEEMQSPEETHAATKLPETAAKPTSEEPPWVFRGFVEPMMENGHETGWKH